MITDKEYPATHSMATSWFAIDLDGNVAILNFEDNGPVPLIAGADESECSVLTEILPEKSNELPYSCLEFTKDEIDEIRSNLPSCSNRDITRGCVMVKVANDKLNHFIEIIKEIDRNDVVVCLNKEEGLFYIDLYDDDKVNLLIEKNIIKPICDMSTIWCGDIEYEKELALSGYPFYVYRQDYSPNIPIKRTQVPKLVFKEDRLSKDAIMKAIRLPIRFDETENFHISMYIPTRSYADTRVIDDTKYLDLDNPDGGSIFVAQNAIYTFGCGKHCRLCYTDDSECRHTTARQFSMRPTVFIISDLNVNPAAFL